MKMPPVDYRNPGIIAKYRSKEFIDRQIELRKFNAAQGIAGSEHADMFRIRARLQLAGKPCSSGGVWSVARFVSGAIKGAIESGKDMRTFTVY